MKKNKILFGICGLGNGHTYRQLPLVEHFSKIAEVVIFAHDNSYNFYNDKYKNIHSVTVIQVAMPFYVGNKNGLDFKESAELQINQKDIFNINCVALAKASKELGKPDLVITDYESVSAQYAYAHNAPLITIDQQSKYLCGDFPEELSGTTFKDEVERLHMFFPKVAARIACSFFKVPLREDGDEVYFSPPTLKDSVVKMNRHPKNNSILVYISAAREFGQTPEEIVRVCATQENFEFHIFLGQGELYDPKRLLSSNIHIYEHGNSMFDEIMQECSGIVSTAGHSLLSEAMYLNIPVYAIPVSPYEQHMNSRIIDKNKFGVEYKNIDQQKLSIFLNNLTVFKKNIETDTKILLRGVGQEKIIEFINSSFFND